MRHTVWMAALFALLAAGCTRSSSAGRGGNGGATQQPATPAVAGSAASGTPAVAVVPAAAPFGGSAEITLRHQGSTLAGGTTWNGSGARSQDSLALDLRNDRDGYAVTIEIRGTEPGAYSVQPAAGTSRSARVSAFGPEMFRGVLADAGEVRMDHITPTSCSGSFKATRGAGSLFEGTFSNVPIIQP